MLACMSAAEQTWAINTANERHMPAFATKWESRFAIQRPLLTYARLRLNVFRAASCCNTCVERDRAHSFLSFRLCATMFAVKTPQSMSQITTSAKRFGRTHSAGPSGARLHASRGCLETASPRGNGCTPSISQLTSWTPRQRDASAWHRPELGGPDSDEFASEGVQPTGPPVRKTR